MERAGMWGTGLPPLNEEWTADRFTRAMWLEYGAAGRLPEELHPCPHCARPYYHSNGGACPRCGGAVPLEPPRATSLHFGLM